MTAQNNDQIAGAYYLSGVMETASGFNLQADGTFQFFFSYGALDRSGNGKWAVKDNKVIFNSLQFHEKDFALVSSKKTISNSITIKIIGTNVMFLSAVYCMLKEGQKQTEQFSDQQGIISFPRQSFDAIALVFEYCAERISLFKITEPTHNYFEFTFEPWLLEVFFKDFSLSIDKGALKGGHPLLKSGIYHYGKNE